MTLPHRHSGNVARGRVARRSNPPAPPPATDHRPADRRTRDRAGRVELAARLKWIDPFFSQPTLIFAQIRLVRERHVAGPLLTQVWVTLEETGIGFVIGSVAGVICGIVLGRNKLMADVFGLYIQIANSIPRVVLGSIFVIALASGWRRRSRWPS